MDYVANNQQYRAFSFQKALVFLGLVLMSLAALVVYKNSGSGKIQYPEILQEVVLREPKALQAFTLVDHQNNSFGLEQFTGSWSFLVFGYTQCPDICPATLSQLGNLYKILVNKKIAGIEEVNKVTAPKFIFVSVDPARDTVNVLNEYIRYFNEEFVAVTGGLQDLEAFEDQFNVFHQYDEPNSEGHYAVTHSAEIFLIDPTASIVAKFSPPISTQKVTKQYQELLNYFPLKHNQIQ